MKSLKKQLSLFYWAGAEAFRIENLAVPVPANSYYLVRRIPLAEMLGNTPVDIAEELIGITTSTDWRNQHRRPIMCGDIFFQGEQPWVYVRMKEFEDSLAAKKCEYLILPLQAWPNYAIVNLLPDSVKDLLCT